MVRSDCSKERGGGEGDMGAGWRVGRVQGLLAWVAGHGYKKLGKMEERYAKRGTTCHDLNSKP